MSKITNITGVPLPLAVWLAADGYDFTPGTEKAISVTSIMKPIRQILLRERLTNEHYITPDVTDFIASRLGHTIHDGIERAWKVDYRESMRKLGYPEQLIQRIVINPEEVTENMVPIYIEQRFSKTFMGYRISGKFDMILEGVVQDFKSTSTFSFTKGSKDDDYRLQGSLYRWLNPEKVTADHMFINFIFTDWQRFRAKTDPNYPQTRVQPYRVELLSLEETEAWLTQKIKALEAVADLPEEELPFCTDKELWRSEPQFKYYSDPAKAGQPGTRSTKNFDDPIEARKFMASKGGKGAIIEIPGQVKACSYCPAFPICSQKDLYEHG